MVSIFIAGCLLCTAIYAQTSDVKFTLNGNDWKVSNATKSLSASVPGNIYVDLMNAGIIDDPYYGSNPDEYAQWIGVAENDWTYTKSFTLTNDVLNRRVVQLIAEGLDTLAEVYINDQLIFTNDNMYQRNNVEIKKFLKVGDNSIKIIFPQSKVTWANETAYTCNVTADGLCPFHCPSSAQHGFCQVNFIRTEPCSFSWDWGPAFAPIGIWKDIYLQAYDTAVIRDVVIWASPTGEEYAEHIKSKKVQMSNDELMRMSEEDIIAMTMRSKPSIDLDYSQWNVTVVAFVDSGNTNVLKPSEALVEYMNEKKKKKALKLSSENGQINVMIDALNIKQTIDLAFYDDMEVNVTIQLPPITNVKPWYPNGWGDQPLYTINTTFMSGNMSDEGVSQKYGFRQIELIQDPLPSGRSFFFRVNGIDTPIHGSNWIPADAFESPQRVNRSSLDKYFVALQESGQNMIRNWGGGIYQHDFYYDLADEYGILIWEDFMFACSQYWVEENFINSVRKEVFDQVRRIQSHASIAIWAGNNENGGYCNSEPGPYAELYFKTILDNVAILDPSRVRLANSPSNGDETEDKPCSSNAQDPYYGDTHIYLYNTDCWNVSVYHPSRFMSEFGLQSWPSFSTMSEYLPEDQWTFNSPMMQDRNHHPNGQSQILGSIALHYNMPSTNSSLSSEKVYEYMLYLSMAYQAYCYKTEVEFFRSVRYQCDSNTPGCMMGEMYWQTNDIWPGASWSSVDWMGRYKMAMYYANKFYAKTIVSGFINDRDGSNSFEFWAITDALEPVLCDECQLNLTSYSWERGQVMREWTAPSFSLNGADARLVYSIEVDLFLYESDCVSMDDCVLSWTFGDGKGNEYSDNFIFIGSPKDVTSKDPELEIMGVAQGKNAQEYDITLSAEGVAAFVWLETKLDGYFTDNGFLMAPGQKMVTFKSRDEKLTLAEVKAGIYVYSLYDAGGFKSDDQEKLQFKQDLNGRPTYRDGSTF